MLLIKVVYVAFIKFCWHVFFFFFIHKKSNVSVWLWLIARKIFTIFRENEMRGIFDVQLAQCDAAAHSLVLDRVSIAAARDARNTEAARYGTTCRTVGRKAGTLSGVRGHSNFTRGLTLRRVECAPPPSSSSSSFLSFLPRPRFHHQHPPPLRRGKPCYANSEIHPVQPLMNVRASCDNHHPRLPSFSTRPPSSSARQYRTRECTTTSTWPMKSGDAF